jgi:ribonuclease BN (tRNA processing enzyme)
MQVKILGCSGGIGGKLRTTSILIDRDILIDAGTGAADLSIEEMMAIDHIFITHSHLDHIASLPMLVDTVIGLRDKHIKLHATRETWQILQDHIFNWKIWPDYTTIPDTSNPFIVFSEVKVGETVVLGDRKITPLPVNHVVPTVGYQMDSGVNSLVFTSDTTTCDALWEAVNRIDNLKYVIIETSFGNAEIDLARRSKHLCPSLLIEELHKLKQSAQIFITHLKPGEDEAIMRQVNRDATAFNPQALRAQQVLEL